jgi:uncharacterized membrane protein
MSETESPKPTSSVDPRRNPFAASTAHVKNVRQTIDAALVDRPNKVASGRGLAWWREGWGIFREAGWLWVGIGFALMVINTVLGTVPTVGGPLASLLFLVFSAGFMLGCHAIDTGEGLRFGHLFAGFQKNRLGRLLMIEVLCLLVIAIIAVAAIIVFFVFATGGRGSHMFIAALLIMNLRLLLCIGLICFVPIFLLYMAMWFAAALVVLHEPTAFAAIKLSLRGYLRNWLPFLVYSLAFMVLAILASLPFMLGWLMLMPMICCSTYAAYRDIFIVERQQPAMFPRFPHASGPIL